MVKFVCIHLYERTIRQIHGAISRLRYALIMLLTYYLSITFLHYITQTKGQLIYPFYVIRTDG
ncbi:unnamed protein product [Onchocerca flexuosa]|uniref:Bestrophin homolog n=1 Tax=Onchocerca flexuosa TaxID=387005 RepID=A0A183HVK1_9BILA|nr:unnamed protein product [Onchocerca flexuosa]